MKQKYKQTEIGVIPEDWEITTLEKEYELFAGGDLNTDDYSDVKTSKYQYAILSNGLQNNGVYGFCSRPKYCGNAVTITGRGDIGHCVYRENAFSAIIRLLVCQPRKQINSKFISEYLESTKPFVFESTGVPQLTVPQIKNTLIPLPPFAEQNRIAEALSDIDELISSLEKLIAKKKAIKQGTMQQLLTGKTRLPGFTSPWEKKKIDDLGRFVSGNGFPLEYQGQQQGKYPFYKVSDFNSPGNERFLHRANNYISDEIVNTLNCNIIPEKSIVFAKIGAAIFLERKKFTTAKCCIDNNTMSFQPDNSYSALYIWYLFQTICLGNLVEATALPSLSGRTIGSVQRDIPSTKNEQDYIANVLLEIDIDIESIEKKLAKTRQLKQGMMQQLLTGKTRIGGDKR